MWWRNGATLLRLAGVVVAGAMMAGCFQPLYGDHSLVTGTAVAPAMAGVDVAQIAAPNGSPESRVAVQLRNELLFNLTGGAGGAPPTHRLVIRMSSTRLSVIVDITSGRPDVEDYGINATYTLTDLKTNKIVVTSETYSRVSYDIPGQEQRFARARALRDVENRASKLIADNIKERLASYFVAGT